MILINKFEPAIAIDAKHYRCFHQHDELIKIHDFIDLPESIRQIEQQNSRILRTYYANALDHNIIDIKTVKYIVQGKMKPKGMAERGIEQYLKAEAWLETQLDQPLQVSMLYQLQKLLILDLYNNREDINLFSVNSIRNPEKLSPTAEIELEGLFEYLNHDDEQHPIVQSWILHFKLLSTRLFSEGKGKIASLMQNFWLKKKGMDLLGLLSIEHELYLNKNDYQQFFIENRPEQVAEDVNSRQAELDFGVDLYSAQVDRLKLLLRSYFRKQVDFDKLNPRQKNIMNYVFERGYHLREIDDSVLNKRQKLIMYIIQHKGFIATKELTGEFECNRKTIQRDFNALVEQNLVKVIGKGAGLRYAVNLQEQKNVELLQYQSDIFAEEELTIEEE